MLVINSTIISICNAKSFWIEKIDTFTRYCQFPNTIFFRIRMMFQRRKPTYIPSTPSLPLPKIIKNYQGIHHLVLQLALFLPVYLLTTKKKIANNFPSTAQQIPVYFPPLYTSVLISQYQSAAVSLSEKLQKASLYFCLQHHFVKRFPRLPLQHYATETQT